MSDFWDAAAGVLGTVAPMLATAVGGPLAGVATGAIVKALGLPEGASPQEAAAAVAGANPDQLLALKKADQEFAETMAKLELDTAKLTTDDRASARVRETSVKDRTPSIMGYIVLVGFFGVAAAAVLGYVPENSTMGAMILGYLAGDVKQVLGYYFGGSAGDDTKTNLLFKSTPAQGGAPQPPFGR